MSAPLTDLLMKKCKFVWDETCQNSFENIKDMLSNAPVLLAPNLINYLNLLLMLVMSVQGEYFNKKMKMVLIILFVISHINLTNTRKYFPQLKKSVLH